jgi:hypothetical protein
VNIAATTALQALHPLGREMALKAGANILMPLVTIPKYRRQYQLYDNKPCLEDGQDQCRSCLAGRVASIGDRVGWGQWGDSPHFFNPLGREAVTTPHRIQKTLPPDSSGSSVFFFSPKSHYRRSRLPHLRGSV